MTALARVTLLDLRTVAPYRWQVLLTPLLLMAAGYARPEVLLPAVVVLTVPWTAGYPFLVADRADLDTLYAVLPLTRRSLLIGRYLWALASFVVTGGIGLAVSLLFARLEGLSFGGYELGAVVAVSWVLFALNVSVQFPMFVRFGYSRAGMLGTALPIALAVVVAVRAHFDLRPSAVLLILLAAGGAVVFGASAAVALAIDPRRARRPIAA